MNNKILLCTDLDRTLIPNGEARENDDARARFRQLCKHPDITLIYVSGRDLTRVLEAMHTFELPNPDYIVADVGSSIYCRDLITDKSIDDDLIPYKQEDKWLRHIAEDWRNFSAEKIINTIGTLQHATLQPDSQQGQYKISYHVTPSDNLNTETAIIKNTLKKEQLNFNCISSIDETCDQGLIDILPASANKKHAVDFIVSKLNIDSSHVFFSGDSGNDLDMLTSGYFATLVNNATNDVKSAAIELAKTNQCLDTLYIASGMPIDNVTLNNGNYASGIIEGFLNFFPRYKTQINLEQLND